jgi:hypothetical protein
MVLYLSTELESNQSTVTAAIYWSIVPALDDDDDDDCGGTSGKSVMGNGNT